MTAPDNERPSTEDVRVSDEAVRRAADALDTIVRVARVLNDEAVGSEYVARRLLHESGYPEEVRLLTAELHASGEHLVRLNERVAELEAENTRLREALDYIAHNGGTLNRGAMRQVARAALARPADTKGGDMSGHTPRREIRDRAPSDRWGTPRIRSVQESALRVHLIEVAAEALEDYHQRGWELEEWRDIAEAVVDALGVEHYTDVTSVDPVNGGLPLYRLHCLEDQ